MQRIFYFSLIIVTVVGCSGPKALYDIRIPDRKVPTEVAFVNKTEDVDSVYWYFGDGQSSTDTSAVHTYYLSGRYPITLEVYRDGKRGSAMDEIILTPPTDCLILMKTTLGKMIIELYNETPRHRDNFIKLAEEGFLDSLLFHRVIEGFMIQGGDPNSKNADGEVRLGSGGPGYQIDAEFVDSLIHIKGALAAARQGDMVNPQKRSSGSQFYIVQGRKISPDQLDRMTMRNGIRYSDEAKEAYANLGGTPQLDGSYTVFGRVIEGLEIIDKIASVQTNNSDRPLEDVRILDVTVIK